MGPAGHLVTIKRSGVDGPHFPLTLSTCLFGRGIECDIRIQLPVVSKQHCKIEIKEHKATLFNFSAANPAQVNGAAIREPVPLKHGDVITIVDRSFRYENESQQNGSKSTEFPGQRCEQASSRRVSRSSFSSDAVNCQDGKVQDPKAHSILAEGSVSGGPLAHAGDVRATHAASRAPEEPVTERTPRIHASDLPGENRRDVAGPAAAESREDSRVTSLSGNRGLKSFPSIQCLENSDENESPFRKLYESMKEELDVKSGTRRKSGSRSLCAAQNKSVGGLQGETVLLVSPKSRRRSSRSTQIQADPAWGAQGSGWTEEERMGEGPIQTPKFPGSPSITPTAESKTKSPVQRSHQSPSPRHQSRALSISQGGEPASPDPSGGFRAENRRTFTPRKSFTRSQTPAEVESTDHFGNTPEKLFPRKRRRSSMASNVAVLTIETEIQKHAALAPLLAQVERKVPEGPLGSGEPLGTTAEHRRPGVPGLRSVDIGSFSDSTNKMGDMPSKRRRVSFGSHLRPELFDENLPPNTPLKRGETPMKRRSLVAHTPPVLKKTIKEQPLPAEEDSSEVHPGVTAAPSGFLSSPARDPVKTPAADDRRRRSSRASPASSGSKCPQGTEMPKSGGRRHSGGPSRRASDRSQQGILQTIQSRRRSGASEANLIVAKSWADIVKLNAKQTQTKVLKHGPRRQLSKRSRRINTPKKPAGRVHNQFSTGHANSPCTIVIGRAHLEKVNVPARPYRMLNNFVFNKKINFNEDLSGLAEMFKTPVKEKPRVMNICPIILSNSEDLLTKSFHVPRSEEKSLLCTPENLGENVFPGTENAPEQMSTRSSANLTLRQQCLIVKESTRTPPSETERAKAASSASQFRRSAGARSAQMPGTGRKSDDADAISAENILGRRLRNTARRDENLEEEMPESKSSFETCKKDTDAKGTSEKAVAVRRSRRTSELKGALGRDQGCPERLPQTEAQGALGAVLRIPGHSEEAVDAENRAAAGSGPAKGNIQVKTPPRSVRGGGLSALGTPTQTLGAEDELSAQTPGGAPCSHRGPGGDADDITFMQTPEQTLHPLEHVTGSRKRPRTPKAQPLEDLVGFKELFQTPSHTVEPVTDDKSTKIPHRSPQAEAVNTPTCRYSRLKTPPGKVHREEDLSALRKPAWTPGEPTRSPREPADDEKSTRALKKTPEQKLDPTENVTGRTKKPRTPKRKVQPFEDLTEFKELFLTPDHTVAPVTDGETTQIPYKLPKPASVNTPIRKGRLKTPLGKVDGDLLALEKPAWTLGEPTRSPREPADDGKSTRALKETPEQKLGPAENVTGRKKKPRTPKRKLEPLEDLAGLKELFQTPDHIVAPVTDDKTTQIPHISPKPEPVDMPISRKSCLKTPQGKVDRDLSALGKPAWTPGEPTRSHGEPEGAGNDIRFKETAKNVTGNRRSQTPKRKIQPLEDLAGFKELFQTPDCTDAPVTNDKTTQIPHKSPKLEPVNMPTSRKSHLTRSLGKVDGEEDLSALGKLTRTPVETTRSHREAEGDEKSIKALKEAAEQKLDPAENVTGSKRRSRTPKRKNVLLLEDLAAFKELFQTSNHTVDPVTSDKTTKVLSQSPQPELIMTPSSVTRQLKTPPRRAGGEQDPSALGKPTQTSVGTPRSPRGPGGDAKAIRAIKETPEQTLGPAEHGTGSKKPRTPKRKVQPLEDLAGLKELFLTPDHPDAPVTDGKATQVPHESPKPEPVDTPTSRKSRLKMPLRKVDRDLSALGKPARTPGEPTRSHGEPEGADNDIKLFKKTAENVTRNRSRTPKRKIVLPLEDLAAFKELFQTPNRTVDPVTSDKTTKVLSQSPQPELIMTPSSVTRQLKTPPRRAGGEQDPSALGKPTQTSVGTPRSPRGPGGDAKAIRAIKETPEQTLGPAEHGTGSKKPRTPKRKVQPLEDLAGLKELFLTPDHPDAPVTDGKATQVPHESPKPEPVDTPSSRKSRLKTPLGKVDRDLSAPRKLARTPGGPTRSHGEPEGDEESSTALKKTAEPKLDPAEKVTGSERKPRTPKRKVQTLEDLAGLKELFQTPSHTVAPVTDGKTTQMPHKSPKPEPVDTPTSRESRLKTPLGKVDRDLSALGKPARTPGEPTRSHGEPEGADNDIKLFKKTAENVTRNRSRTPKRKIVLPLEDLAAFKELFQTPNRTVDPVTSDKTTKVLSQSPQPELVMTPSSVTRQLKTPPRRAGGEQEQSALRQPTWPPGGTPRSPRGPGGDAKAIRAIKETPEQTLGPAEHGTGNKKPRTPKRKVQPLEDLARLKELFLSPDHPDAPVTDGKATQVPHESPKPEPVDTPSSRKSRLKMPLRKADKEDLSAPRKPARTPGGPTRSPTEPEGDDNSKLLKETAGQKSAENVTRSRRPRTSKRKGQPLENLAGLKDLFQSPDHMDDPVTDDKATVPHTCPQAEAVMPPGRPRRLRAPPGKVDTEVERSALRKPTQTSGKAGRSLRKPRGDDTDTKLFQESVEPEMDPAENGTRSRRKPRTTKEKAQPLEDPAGPNALSQSPDHADEPGTGVKTTRARGQSAQAGPAAVPASEKPRLRGPPGRADGAGQPSALSRATRSGRSARSHREPAESHKDVSVSEDSSRQKLAPADSAAGSGRRLRTRGTKAPSLDGPAACPEFFQPTDQHKDLGRDAESVQRTPAPTPDRRQPVKASRRVLKAPDGKPKEDLAGSREPVRPQSESAHLSPKRKRGTDGGDIGRKRLRTTTSQDTAQEMPLQKRQRVATRERRRPPEPLMVKSQRLWAGRGDPVEEPPGRSVKTAAKGRKAEDVTAPDQVMGMSLRSRRPNKTRGAEQTPAFPVSAEKVRTKKNEKKAPNPSPEVQCPHPEGGAKNAPSGGRVPERMCLRSRGQRAMPLPSAAKEKVRERRGQKHVLMETRAEKEGPKLSGVLSLRSRKTPVPPAGGAVQSDFKQRATRSTKGSTENTPKEDNTVCIKKIRTRSQWHKEAI